MKISRTQLKQVIREEARRLKARRLREAGMMDKAMDYMSKKVLQNPDEFTGNVELDELASCVRAAAAAGIPAGEIKRVVSKNLR